jgi:transposase
MSKKHRYSSQDVEKFDVATVVALLVAGWIVAVDVAKTKFYAGTANLAGDVVRIVRFEHPKQTRSFLGVLEALSKAGSPAWVVMEPTGSYGDALRYQCHAMGVPVFMSSPKHTHDMAEVLDGVPSMHDAKAVVVLAKLHAIQPGRQWQPETRERRDLRTVVDRHAMYADTRERLFGRLEGLIARWWPEFGWPVRSS